MARHPKPFVLGTPPSKAERLRDKNKNEYPSPPASKNRKGGPGRKEVEFAKKMAGHPNEIKTQVVKTNLPQKSKCPVETEPMRLAAIKKKKAREAEIRADNKPANIEYMKDCITNAFPSDVDMVVAPNIFWDGGKDMAGYFEWLLRENYEGEMPEIVRRANAFRGFPQLDDEDSNPEGAEAAAERRAYYRSKKGRDELRPYLPAIKKYASKGEYELIKAQVDGQAASYKMAAADDSGEPDDLELLENGQEPYPSDSGPSPAYYPGYSPTSEAGPASTYYKLKGEYSTPTPLAAAHAVDELSSQLDRSATLGCTPQDSGKESRFSDILTPDPNKPWSPEMCSTGMLEQCRDELGSAYFRERDENKAIWKARKAQEALLDEEPKEEPMSNGRPVFDTPPGYDGYGRQFEDTLPAYGYSPLSDSGYRKEEEVKDEEMSAAAAVAAPSAGLSTPSGYSPTSDYGRKEDEVKDEEMSASAAPVAESTADLSVPIAPTPDPTPLKEKTAKRNRKRKESFDEEWKPSPYDILSGDDDKPLIKRVKKESPQAARHWWEV